MVLLNRFDYSCCSVPATEAVVSVYFLHIRRSMKDTPSENSIFYTILKYKT